MKVVDSTFFALSNEVRGQATELVPKGGKGIRGLMNLSSPSNFEDDKFQVEIDGVRLGRPLMFGRAQPSAHAVLKDLMFVGKCSPDLSLVPEEFRGGNLSFEAYLYWSPKIIPKDHNGVLVRLKGASGTLFDPTFMGYQVSEQTRLKQLSAEIYVLEGLEGALNIDRESFNYASIHYQFISRWLHGAIRQFSNRQKLISSKLLGEKKVRLGRRLGEELLQLAEQAWTNTRGKDGEAPPEIVFDDDDLRISERRSSGAPTFARAATVQIAKKSAGNRRLPDLEPRLKAIALILQAYGVFDSMPYSTQEELIAEIAKVISAEVTDGN